MINTQQTETPKDRLFDPSRIPATDASRALITEVLARVQQAEQRKRKRRQADQQRHEAALTALVCDLVHRALDEPEAWLMVEMSNTELSPTTRRAPFLTEAFPRLVRLLCGELGIAELQPGYFQSWTGGEKTKIRVAAWLDMQIDDRELEFRDIGRDPSLMGDPLILRSTKTKGKATELSVPDTEQVRALRAQMIQINGWIAQANLSYDGPELIDLGQRYLRRIFNDGSLDQGGRLYHGFWQEMSKDDRASLRIDGSPVVSLDFAQMSVRTAYALAGVDPPKGDLYDIPGANGSREGIKLVLNALIAGDKMPTRMPRGARKHFRNNVKVTDVVRAIGRQHPVLIPLFGKAHGLSLQHWESQVIVTALLRLQAIGVVALPIHDCLLVGKDQEETAKEMLEMASLEVLGQRLRVEVEGAPSRALP